MKKYKDNDGAYLSYCTDENELHTFGWYYDEDACITCTLNDMVLAGIDKFAEAPTTTSDWESWIVWQTAKEMGCDKKGRFNTAKDAKVAMRAANEALLRGDKKPVPQWVVLARNAGWTPPEGWTL